MWPELALALALVLTLLRLFHSAEVKVFWQLAEEAVVLPLPVAAEAVPSAVQAMGSAPPAAWESERCRVLAPVAPILAAVQKWAVAKEY